MKPLETGLKVLIGCESSGNVRRAFRALGHNAWSCDLLAADDGDPHHIRGDVEQVLDQEWDIAILHPPCTRLANSGVRWLAERGLWDELREGARLFNVCLKARAHRHLRREPDPAQAC